MRPKARLDAPADPVIYVPQGRAAMAENGGRANVHDLARAAGVSLATIDRVLNGRPGVRAKTVEKVEKAIAEIGFKRDLAASMLARARAIAIAIILPDGANPFMALLAEAATTIGPQMRAQRLEIALERIRGIDAVALARALDALDPGTCDCAVIVAIDTPAVREAVARAAARGIAVVTLVSDLPGSARRAFVGIDNVAAGRTAASLMGRFVPAPGTIGLVAGSLALSDHAARIAGFRAVMDQEFAGRVLLAPIEGGDRFTATYENTRALLDAHPDLAGIYNVGAGNGGLLMALAEKELSTRVRVIAHELTRPTRAGLVSSAVDAVIDQGPEDEIRAVCAVARGLVLGADAVSPQSPLEIRVFLRDNLR